MAGCRFLIFGAMSVVTASCALVPSPEPKYYELSSFLAVPSSKSEGDTFIGLSEISLPAYARNQQITTVASTGEIFEDDDHRWAVPPTEAVTDVLARSLETQTGATVVQTPFPRGVEPNVRVEVSFDRLLRNANGGAHVRGQYIVVRVGGAVTVKRFDIEERSSGTAYTAYMAAMTSALDKLSALIANEINPVAP